MIKKFYTWIEVKKGLCVIFLKTEYAESCKTYCIERNKKYVAEVTFKDAAAQEAFEANQDPAIKLTAKSESEFKKLRDKTEYWAFEQEALKQVQNIRLSALNESFNTFTTRAIGEEVPATEMLTWETQERESLSYKQSGYTDDSLCPTMKLIAQNRGVELKILCDKCIEKSAKYRALSSTLIGKRQKFQDAIESAQTQEEVFAVEFSWEE